MQVILRNPSKEIISQVDKKEGMVLDLPDLAEREDDLIINDVLDIKDMTRIASCDFALYKKDAVIYVDNADFSEMEVRL
jgi:hypothetical protein